MAAVFSRKAYLLPRAVEEGAEIFAIGDIHGRPDLLEALLDQAGREPRRSERRLIVFLGDLIDRGPDSLGAVDLALGSGERLEADETVMLMGNHEAMLRLALEPDSPWEAALDALANWLRNGGAPVARQFLDPRDTPEDPEELLTIIRVAAPPRLLGWLQSLRPWRRSGDVLFVHAGVNPAERLDTFLATPWDVPLAQLQQDRHWAWIRWPFLEFRPDGRGFGGLFVVHGHTPNDAGVTASHEEQIARFRLNLDAGSGLTGMAKLAIFREAEVRVISAIGPTNAALDRD